MAFSVVTTNNVPTTTNKSKSKPQVEFQYGGHPLSETGRSNNSAADCNNSSKFGVQIDFERGLSIKPKP